MATVQSHPFDPSLEDLPAWKKDLILRKRANSKIHGGLPVRSGGKTTPNSPNGIPPQQMLLSSVQGNTQLSSRSVRGDDQDSTCFFKGQTYNCCQSSQASDRSGSADGVCVNGENKSDGEIKSVIIANAMRAPTNMYQKGLADCSPRAKGPWNGAEEDEGDLEYGPGIVSRLKNRYMSIAMREARGRTALRRYCSLEDLLDDDGPEWPERGRAAQKTRPLQEGSPRDYMKRARSMDSLALRRMDSRDKVPKSHSSGALRPANLNALGNEDIIIIETTRPTEQNGIKTSVLLTSSGDHNRRVSSSSSLLDEEEMPTPDIVKQVKQIFESTSGRPTRGTAAKVAAYKAAQAKNKKQVIPTNVKPALKAKPPQLQARKSFPSPIEEVKSNLKPVSTVGRVVPRSTLSAKPVPSALRKTVTPTVTLGLTPVTASVTSPCINGVIEEGIKKIKSSAISNIRKESLHEEFNFTAKEKHFLQEESRPRPQSPVANLPPSPTLSHRVNIPPTFKNEIDDSKENERVLQENKKNSEKSKPFSKESNQPEMNSPPPMKFSNSPQLNSQPKFPQLKLLSPPPTAQQPSFPIANSPTKQSNPVYTVKPTSVAEETKASVFNQRTNLKQVPSQTIPTGYNETSSLLEVLKAVEVKDTTFSETSSANSPSVMSGLKSSKSKDSRRNQQDNTTFVFNFSKRTDTPDYIENDGVDMSKRQHFDKSRESGYILLPDYHGKNDSSTDDFDEDLIDAKNVGGIPAPCNIIFEGEAVIINGRSNLQRQPRSKKLEISFDMDSTRTFEYPSEMAVQEELMDDLLSVSSGENNALLSNGGLANYTPSNLQFNDSFELGVSRRALPPTPPREKPNPFDDNLEEEHIRPADESEIVTWSEESAPDMLF